MSSPMTLERRWLIVSVVCALTAGVVAGRVTGKSQLGANMVARSASPQTQPKAQTSATRFQIPISDSQPSQGPEDALVTIVEWSDVRCGQCARAEALVEDLRKEYGDKLRVVWRNDVQESVPDALAAADLAMEAHTQAGKFWQMLALLRAHAGPLTESDLLAYAKQLGLDDAGVKRALEQQAHRAHIVNDRVFASRFGVRELPAFFINGVPFTGPQSPAGWKTAIEPELQRAQRLVAGGVAPKNVYAELTKGASWNVPDWKNPTLAR